MSMWLADEEKMRKLGRMLGKKIAGHKRTESYLIKFEHSFVQTSRVMNTLVKRRLKEGFENIHHAVGYRKKVKEALKIVLIRAEYK